MYGFWLKPRTGTTAPVLIRASPLAQIATPPAQTTTGIAWPTTPGAASTCRLSWTWTAICPSSRPARVPPACPEVRAHHTGAIRMACRLRTTGWPSLCPKANSARCGGTSAGSAWRRLTRSLRRPSCCTRRTRSRWPKARKPTWRMRSTSTLIRPRMSRTSRCGKTRSMESSTSTWTAQVNG